MDKYITIGYTKKTYGSKGQVKIVVEEEYLDDLLDSEFVFIEYMGKPLPFFIESIEEPGDLLLKVEDVDTPQEAHSIVSKKLLLREKDISAPLKPASGDDLYFGEITGFLIIDKEKGQVGSIKEIRQFPQQEMAILEYKGSDILIPLHPGLIVSIDKEHKTIIMKLPEGLLDL